MNRYTSADARLRQAGFMAVHKQDFNAHYRGEDFQHGAPDILMEPPLPAFPTAPTVQDTLNMMYHLISTQGSGFISIGNTDGYELGDYNAGSLACPTVYDAFNAAFTDSRLDNGGIILVLEGTYHLTQTVTIPAGICVMGGISGTTIIGETSETPMFIISRGDEDLSIGGDSGGGAISHDMGSPLDQVKFFNIILADNLEGVVKSGGVIISTMTTCPMIKCNSGSDFECENVRFIGRVDDGPEAARTKTLRAIGYQSPAGYASHLKVKHCFFDGVRTAIDFDSQEGVSDFLVIEGCRARTFGTEDIASLAAVDNCFASFSLCNANFANNYHVGFDGTWRTVGTCFAVASTNGTLTDIKVVITGNSGGPNTNIPLPNILRDETGTSTTIRAIKSGNSWGTSIQNDWFVTVGSNAPTVNEPSGDFIGINSLDTIFENNKANPFTVILNPGTYNLSSAYGGRFKLIGNKINGKYPTVVLKAWNFSGWFGVNFVTVGCECKSIKFINDSDNLSRMVVFYQNNIEVYGTDGKGINVDDCIFYDCGIGSEPQLTASTRRTIISIKNCFFYSTSAVTPNVTSIFFPKAENTVIDNCNFSVYGPAMDIGMAGGSTTVSENLIIKNCSIYCRGISSFNPMESEPWGYPSFICIAFTRKVTMENCQVFCNEAYSQTNSVIGAGEITNIQDFITIIANSTSIINCVFHGPDQNAVLGGIITPIRTLSIYPYSAAKQLIPNVKIDNSKIRNGALPLSIQSLLGWPGGPLLDIKISNSEIISTSGAYGCYTVAAIYQDLLDLPTQSRVGNIVLDNCTFGNAASINDNLVFHQCPNNVANSVTAVVYIDAPGSNITVSKCRIYGAFSTVGIGVTSVKAALSCNNFATTAGPTTQPLNIKIIDNEISMINYHDTSVHGDIVSSLDVRGSVIDIKGNHLNMCNLNVPAGAVARPLNCLHIMPEPTTGATAMLDVIVSGNLFSRRNLDTAALTTIYNGYIWVESTATSPRGMIVDNSFCSPTIDGADTTLVTDNTDRKFIYERNKNQTKEIEIRCATGSYNLTSNLVMGAVPSCFADPVWTLDYTDPNIAVFNWDISLLEIIPHGTYVVSASISAYMSDADAAAPKTVTLYLRDLSPKADNDSINLTDVSQTVTITPTNTTNANTYYIDSDGESNMTVTLAYQHGDTNTIYIDAVVLQYRW